MKAKTIQIMSIVIYLSILGATYPINLQSVKEYRFSNEEEFIQKKMSSFKRNIDSEIAELTSILEEENDEKAGNQVEQKIDQKKEKKQGEINHMERERIQAANRIKERIGEEKRELDITYILLATIGTFIIYLISLALSLYIITMNKKISEIEKQ